LEKAPEAFRTISEVADELDVPQHVLRFWESRFRDIKPMKRGGGRRYYRPEDIDLLRGIRHLLYGEGYTIRGVQRILRDQGVKFVQAVWQPGAAQPSHRPAEDPDIAPDPDIVPQEAETGNGAHPERERSRLLLGLLPVLAGDAETQDKDGPTGGRAEPLLEPVDRQRAPQRPLAARNDAVPSTARLPREDLRKLEAVLHALAECRELLGAALDPPQ
jgi:DNA-binding transcriptional MerR regulator